MHHFPFLKQTLWQEDGSFVSSAILLAIIIAVLAIAVIDGSSVFYTYSAVNNGTEEAAKLALDDYKNNRNYTRAEQVAIDHCQEKGLTFVDVTQVPELGSNSFAITCSKDAKTYVFKRLPYLKNLIHQEITSTAYQSY